MIYVLFNFFKELKKKYDIQGLEPGYLSYFGLDKVRIFSMLLNKNFELCQYIKIDFFRKMSMTFNGANLMKISHYIFSLLLFS